MSPKGFIKINTKHRPEEEERAEESALPPPTAENTKAPLPSCAYLNRMKFFFNVCVCVCMNVWGGDANFKLESHLKKCAFHSSIYFYKAVMGTLPLMC